MRRLENNMEIHFQKYFRIRELDSFVSGLYPTLDYSEDGCELPGYMKDR
jgi:hypothetical protein